MRVKTNFRVILQANHYLYCLRFNIEPSKQYKIVCKCSHKCISNTMKENLDYVQHMFYWERNGFRGKANRCSSNESTFYSMLLIMKENVSLN